MKLRNPERDSVPSLSGFWENLAATSTAWSRHRILTRFLVRDTLSSSLDLTPVFPKSEGCQILDIRGLCNVSLNVSVLILKVRTRRLRVSHIRAFSKTEIYRKVVRKHTLGSHGSRNSGNTTKTSSSAERANEEQ